MWLVLACWVDCVLSESGFTGLWRIYRIVTMRCIVFTLTFDSSPIKGEGKVLGLSYSPSPHPVDSRLRGNDGPWWLCWLVVSPALHLWIADQVRNDVTELSCFTLTFDSSPIKGEGLLVGVVLFTRTSATLWIPAYAGMTVRVCRIGTMRCIVFTLTFDSSPIKGEGKVVGVGSCLVVAPRHPVD